jgi:DNA-binding PadR family transcriptional regulator
MPLGKAGVSRWSDPSLLVLASLAQESRHGYGMIQDIEQMAGVHLGPGTLYGALARLEAQGLIEALAGEGRRRPYRITGAGALALESQLRTVSAVVEVGLSRLRASGAPA